MEQQTEQWRSREITLRDVIANRYVHVFSWTILLKAIAI